MLKKIEKSIFLTKPIIGIVARKIDKFYKVNENIVKKIVKNGGILDSLEGFEINGVNYYNKYRKEFNYDYNLEDVEFYEMFTYPDDRLYSNADDSEVNNGLSIYRWSLSDKDDNFEMILYKLSPNASAWYILALVISILVVTILSIIVIVNRTNKKKSKKQVSVINEWVFIW